MKKQIFIIILLLNVSAGISQQWIPDVNKKYSFTSAWQIGQSLYAVSDTLYVGGSFARISNVNAFNIVRYYNGNWYPLKGGVYGDPLDFLYKNGNLYVAGGFSWADNKPGTSGLARWDGNNWYPIGSNSDCFNCGKSLEYYNGKLFAGGNMSAVGSTVAYGIAAFDGTNWINVGELPPIDYLKSYNSDLLAGENMGYGFLKYEGDTSWSTDPYGGIYGSMSRTEKDTINNLIYVSGNFYFVNKNNPIESHYIAKWDGFDWHSMGTNSGYIYCMKMYNGYLYAGFTSDTLSNGSPSNWICRWDGNQWQPLGTGLNQGANAMEEFHDTLFVTGNFTTAGGDSAYGLARWYMPDTNCAFLHPTIHTLALKDTFYIAQGHADVQFFNNNVYAQSWQWNFGDSGTGNTQNPVHSYTNDSAYTITVTVIQNGCVKTDTAHIVVLWGSPVEEYNRDNLNFKVYPNPTGGDFTIECTLPQNKTGKVRAFRDTGSQLGEHSLESGSNKFIMPSSNWKDSVILVGVYVDGKQVFVEKVVKK